MKRWVIYGLIMVGGLLLPLTACGDSGTYKDEEATDRQLDQYQRVQPIPFFEWSQYRETLISVEHARAKGTATTSFFFVPGVPTPIRVCDSVGYPVPASQQITNPDQVRGSGYVVSQMEPNGTFTGESTGTYVVCINAGKAVPEYFEGFVHTEGGPAKWDDQKKMIITTGPATVETKRQQ